MTSIDLITISKFAKACKVSRQTVYNIVKEFDSDELKADKHLYITVKDNVKHLTAKGQEYIRDKIEPKTEEDNQEQIDPEEATNKDAGDEYKDRYIKLLERQLNIKDEQIRALNIAIEEIQARQKEANILQALERKGLIETVDGEYIEPEEGNAPTEELRPESKEPEEDKQEPRKGIIGFISRLFTGR